VCGWPIGFWGARAAWGFTALLIPEDRVAVRLVAATVQ